METHLLESSVLSQVVSSTKATNCRTTILLRQDSTINLCGTIEFWLEISHPV